jgi:hypothetical protein
MFRKFWIFKPLGAFGKLRKAIISFITYVRLSVSTEQLGSKWTDFHEISVFAYFSKIYLENYKFCQE